MEQDRKKAVVLLSGGLDSTTTLAIAISQGFEIYAMTFDYGQRNRFELEVAERIASNSNLAQHRKVQIDLAAFGGSSLTSSQKVEKERTLEQIGKGIPSTYVPVRNTIFLSYALAWAEVLEARDIFIGVNAVDTSGYPDCRPEFIACFEKLANLGTRLGDAGKEIKIHTPLQDLSKSEIIELGLSHGVDYSQTNTCYDPDTSGVACGCCDACILRLNGFSSLGIKDPIKYSARAQ